MAIDIRAQCPLLSVFDMPASLKFYCDALGFSVVATDGQPVPQCDWVLLRFNGTELMLNTAYERPHRPPLADPVRIAAHEDTAIYFGCADVEGAYQHLRAHSLNVNEPRVARYGMKLLYIRDPDGYNLCFQWPASEGTRQQWRDWYGFDPAKVTGEPTG